MDAKEIVEILEELELKASKLCLPMNWRETFANRLMEQQPEVSEGFPSWQEAVDGITDSRFNEYRDMNIVRSGGRIMYDRLYIMLQSPHPQISEDDIADCLQVGWSKSQIVDAICKKVGIKQREGNQRTN